MKHPLRQPWIWIDPAIYPDLQTSCYYGMADKTDSERGVVRFKRSYRFPAPLRSAMLCFSGDSALYLTCNGAHFRGPASPGGDFYAPYMPIFDHYATAVTLSALPGMDQGILNLEALVRLMPVQMCDYSRGHGGFFLTATVTLADGTVHMIGTDSDWTAEHLPYYVVEWGCDSTRTTAHPAPHKAIRIPDIWHAELAPIPPCTLTELWPKEAEITLLPGQALTKTVDLDAIYAAYLMISADAEGADVHGRIRCYETNDFGSEERLRIDRDLDYIGFTLHSLGHMEITLENKGAAPATLKIGLQTSHYPTPVEVNTTTSDTDLNQVLATCAHTLKYCRQTHHLDSPRHCEPLACTGDYYIEMLMTAFSFGDMKLAAMDIRRTARSLEINNGRMFHTTYSLIWVQMLWDCYRFSGDLTLLSDCEDALILLLDRFEGYLGENGLVETPPDYMFIDWLNPDGINTHHPPKALGQTCLTLFLYGAHMTAIDIFDRIGLYENADFSRERADLLREAILTHLWDEERGLFFEGLNTPTPDHLLNDWLPQNVEKRYYRMHGNILAAYFGILGREGSARLLDRIMSAPELGEVQPYFAHFLLEAVYRNGLRHKYARAILEDWKAPVAECPGGLVEGFYPPHPGYGFDHSHAWGGTPLWSLPLALSGLHIQCPGMSELSFSPDLLGLTSATVKLPTPFGIVTLTLEEGKPPVIDAPQEIEISLT